MRRTGLIPILICLLPLAGAGRARAEEAATSTAAPCATTPHLDHPHALLQRGDLHVLVFLPDAKDGYYRAQRFDWSGVIGCAAYQGHTYWGEWFRHYDPLVNDSITGPVEEFRPTEGAQGYSAARAGGTFVKIGVGVLRKTADVPYKFGDSYPLVDPGQWTVHTSQHAVRFQQRLRAPNGIRYVYTKELVLDRKGSGLELRHTLRNLGTEPIVTDVYNHDFFMLDGQPTGPGFVLHLSFAPTAETSLEHDATIEGQDIRYLKELDAGETVGSYLTGYDSQKPGFTIRLENTRTHGSIEESSEQAIARFYLWSIRSTICPEAYIHIEVPPGQSRSWTIAYHFQAQ